METNRYILGRCICQGAAKARLLQEEDEPGGDPSTGRQRYPERAVPQHPGSTRVVVGTQSINNSVIIRQGEVTSQVQVHLQSPVSMSGQQETGPEKAVTENWEGHSLTPVIFYIV